MKAKKARRIEPTFLEKFRDFAVYFPDGSKATQALALQLVAAGIPGADRAVLELLATSVVENRPIDPLFQSVANAIVAKAVASERFPPKAKGRPHDSAQAIGWDVACEYFELVDAETSYAEAVSQLAAKFNKSERRIMQLVASEKSKVGETREERAFVLAARRVLNDSGVDLTFDSSESPNVELLLDDIIVALPAKRTDPFELLRKAQGEWVTSLMAGVTETK